MNNCLCPCHSQHLYDLCCGPYLTGDCLPTTPLALMRSRYTAYTQANIDYIAKTMQGPAAKGFDAERARQWAINAAWQKLEIIAVSPITQDKGTVEFKAFYHLHQRTEVLHEISEFKKINGRWYYVNGQHPSSSQGQQKKIGRNMPCPCGSGKKFKYCCNQ